MNPLHEVRSRPRPTPRGVLLLLISLVSASSIGGAAYGQDKTAEIDSIFSAVTPETPGCAVGVSQYGQLVASRAYGVADLERGVPITPATIFDIGSIQKQFVAAAVLLLVDEGRIALSDDIHKYFPELPEYGHAITVEHLLTHTSGVRDWIGLSRMSSEDEEALTMILRQRGLNFAPGEEWSYSNSGYVLLKELIARTTGMSFSEFARTRIFEPLGMESTTYAADIRAAGENGALAYEKEGEEWKPDMMLGDERGGGAVLSTTGDLLIWNDALTNGRLGEFVTKKIQEPARLNNGRQLDYARGLFLDDVRGTNVVWHTGSAGAYKAMLARFPEYGLSLAILCNAGDSADRSRFATRIVDLFLPAADETKSADDAPSLQEIDLSGKAGLFFSERTGEPLNLVVHEGRLRIPGGPALAAETEDHFRNPESELDFMSGDEFEIHFLSPDEFELTSMEGETTRYRRAQPYAPTSEQLQAFAGRYESEELRAVVEIAPGETGLMIRLNGSKPFEFTPIDRDTFQLGRMTGRFSRDDDGNVVALVYSNPAMRNVTFKRVNDGTESR